MRRLLRQLWPYLKTILAVAILVVIGRQFVRDLRRPELWERPLQPGWLVLGGLLYLAGLSLSALYWHRLLVGMGARPRLRTSLRAYFLGHLGKYLPGKAWAMLLRGGAVRQGGVPMGLATITAFYEVFAGMAAGVLLAALLFSLLADDSGARLNEVLGQLFTLQPPAGGRISRGSCVLMALALAAPFVVFLHPVLFNWLAHRLARSHAAGVALHHGHLGSGLLLTGMGWLLLGMSLWAVLRAIPEAALPLASGSTALLPAALAVSYVAGFVVLLAPGGLGVREVLLAFFLTPYLVEQTDRDSAGAHASAELAVVVLRLVWTAAELGLAAVLYWSGAPPQREGEAA